MTLKRDPYPLQWPDGWRRTTNRFGRGTGPRDAKFEAMFARDRDAVIRQLKRRGSNIVITSDLPTRNDGRPYADAHARDPGIAVYWVENGHERVIACDRWRSHALNMRAIDLSLEALRGLDRWGASEMVERAFAGFAALPPGASGAMPESEPRPRAWRDVLGMTSSLYAVGSDELDASDVLAIAKARHRERIVTAHPDAGGSHDRAAELNAALAEAESELEQKGSS